MEDVPDLPLRKILSYLSLKDRIRARFVSHQWRDVIDNFRSKSLAYSGLPSGLIYQKSHWISGAFAQNFINSTKFEQFFQTFGPTILANLKHLRLGDLVLSVENAPVFTQILNSFHQLEKLGIYGWSGLDRDLQLALNLPMLKSIQLKNVGVIGRMTLNAPKMQKVKDWHSEDLSLDLVHGESVEKLIISYLGKLEVKNLKNLKYLHCGEYSEIDSTLLSTLDQLEEIHLHSTDMVTNLFEQKKRYSRSNLKIFACGCLLTAPTETAIDSLDYGNEKYLITLLEHRSTMAEEIPLCKGLPYSTIKSVAPGLEIDLLKRFTDLERINAAEPVQDADRFLELLKNLNNISDLSFEGCDQPQQLFDRLPDYCTIQILKISNAPDDFDFLFRLKGLIYLVFKFPIDVEFVSKVFEKLPFLSFFIFKYLSKPFMIRVDHLPKQVKVSLLPEKETNVSDVNAAIQFIIKKAQK